MYNRYIPQPDGSYRRSRQQESQHNSPAPPAYQEPAHSIITSPAANVPPPISPRRPRSHKPAHPPQGIGSFLKQLLPRDFDTEDLLIVLLLLLMSNDCQEDQNSALLTLALYLFL